MMPIFLDFESNGLSSHTFPIEIGLAYLIDDEIHSWGSLIKPAPSWPDWAWDYSAHLIHGIYRRELDEAPTPWEAADKALELLSSTDFVCYSDSPPSEYNWLRMLLDEHPSTQEVEILDFDRLIQNVDADEAIKYLEQHPIPHRAEADARRLAEAYKAACKWL